MPTKNGALLNTYLLVFLAVLFVAAALSLPQKADAVGLCPGEAVLGVIGLLHTCVDSSGNPLNNPDGSLAYSFTTLQVAEWAENNGQDLPEVITQAKEAAGSCGLDFYRCFWNPLIAALGSVPTSIGAWVLTVSGMLFNFLVDHTIIEFKVSIIDRVGDGIDVTWTAFRDIANIVIIGMFTFIAISLILGIKEYGERKMIARVLIVAVL